MVNLSGGISAQHFAQAWGSGRLKASRADCGTWWMSHRHGGFRAGQRGRKSENVCDKDRVNLSVIFIYLTFCLLSPYTYENTQKHIQAPPCLVCRLRIGKAWIRNAWQVLFLNSICSWTFHRELSNAVDRLEKLCHNASINLTQVSSFSFFHYSYFIISV